MVKGVEAYKFKCIQGHVFYKNISEMVKPIALSMRKLSKSTAASSCSSDSTSQPSDDVSNLEGLWCPKCENFYKNA